MLVEGKVALVTGAARGMGRGYAEALLQKRAKGVVIVDILDDVAQKTVSELQAQYGDSSVTYVHADVRKDADVKGAFSTAFDKYGGLDIVINNAGVHADESSWEDKQLTIDVDLLGVIRCTEIAIERMRRDKSGRGGVIINISSIVATQALGFSSIYTAAKCAVTGYTRSRGLELGDVTGIKFRTLCPGVVPTDMSQFFVELAEQKNEWAVSFLERAAGYVHIPEVAATCMKVIERDELPQDTVLLVQGDGNWLLYPDQMPRKRLESE